jgi:excisionase family DNA binding protein
MPASLSFSFAQLFLMTMRKMLSRSLRQRYTQIISHGHEKEDRRVAIHHQLGSERLTISVVEAGQRLGVGKQAAYDAAHRGEIPIVRVGRRLLVPVAAFEAMLAVKSKQQIVAAELVRRLQDEPV